MRAPRTSVAGVAALVFVAGALAIVDAGGRRTEGTFPPGSVYSETPEGLALAFRYLGERSSVSVLSTRVAPGKLPADGVLFRVRPRRGPFAALADEVADDDAETSSGEGPPRERSARFLTAVEEAWVRAGGRLVLALDADYGPLGISERGVAGRGAVRKVFPLWPGVRDLEPGQTRRTFPRGDLGRGHTLFARGSDALLSRVVVGRGDVWLLAVPELLENERLAAADHLALLDALAGEGRAVAFDEWSHGLGQDESLVALLLEWGLGPALLLATLSFVLLLWRGRTRLGPEEDDAVEERSEAVDLVDSLAQLYDRALSRREAATLQLQAFRQAVSLRTGLRGAALERRTRELVDEAATLPAGEREVAVSAFLRALQAVNDGYRRLEEHAHSRRRP